MLAWHEQRQSSEQSLLDFLENPCTWDFSHLALFYLWLMEKEAAANEKFAKLFCAEIMQTSVNFSCYRIFYKNCINHLCYVCVVFGCFVFEILMSLLLPAVAYVLACVTDSHARLSGDCVKGAGTHPSGKKDSSIS